MTANPKLRDALAHKLHKQFLGISEYAPLLDDCREVASRLLESRPTGVDLAEMITRTFYDPRPDLHGQDNSERVARFLLSRIGAWIE